MFAAMTSKTSTAVFAVALVLLALAACAPGANGLIGTVSVDGVLAGFWRGLWHGLIAPVTFIVSLFNANVQMYEVHNTGHGYDLGFLIGMSIVFGSTHAGRRASRRPEKIQ
jgi:hypothetical protein